MAAVRHNSKSFSDNERVEAHIENSANIWNRADSIVEIPHAFESDLHDLGFLMLHSKDHRVNYGLKHLALQLKHALSAVIDNVVHQFEEWLSEFWVADKVIRNHFQSRLTKSAEDVCQETSKMLSLLVENSSEYHHCLWVTSIWVRLEVVLNHSLESWEEVLVEIVELTLFLDVDLDQLQDISPYCFHWLQHALISSLLNSVTDAFRVQFVNLDQILKDLA